MESGKYRVQWRAIALVTVTLSFRIREFVLQLTLNANDQYA
jgi:hypothetical protein